MAKKPSGKASVSKKKPAPNKKNAGATPTSAAKQAKDAGPAQTKTQKAASPVGTAALWFAMDGYSTARGVNGRRVAGLSFLKGYIRHNRAEKLSVYSASAVGGRNFDGLARELGNRKPIHAGIFDHHKLPNGEKNLYLPTPNIGREAWRRARGPQTEYAISGVTHTISTDRVTRAIWEMRMAPVQPWDAVICTSQAVVDSLSYQLDQIDLHLDDRFGHVPERFMMPLIPLGINTDDFDFSDAVRAKWRKNFKIEDDWIVVSVVARLASFEKFDPIPMFQALEAAAQQSGKKIELMLIGAFSDDVAKRMFINGRKNYAPSLRMRHVDATKKPAMRNALAAADIFTLPVDNIQETFGLSPVEAMAAGIPVVVTDWNGFKDTVTPECGFRIPTMGPSRGSLSREAVRYEEGLESYNQYLGVASQLTIVDVAKMTEAFVALCDPELRKKMGAAGKKRAQTVFDWGAIIPQYEDLWAEQEKIRAHAEKADKLTARRWQSYPFVPDPSEMFANFPTQVFGHKGKISIAPEWAGQNQNVLTEALQKLIEVRGLKALKRKSAPMHDYLQLLSVLRESNAVEFSALQKKLDWDTPTRLERAVLFMIKYGFAKINQGYL